MIDAELNRKNRAGSPHDLKLDFTIAQTTVDDSEIRTEGMAKSFLKVKQEVKRKSQLDLTAI